MPGWMTRRSVRSQPVQSYSERRLQRMLNAYDKHMSRLNDQYLRMMGEHIRDIGTMWPSDVHRLQQIRRMNKNLNELQRRIGAAAGMTEDEIREVFERIAEDDVRMAQKILGVPDTINVKDNLPLQRILRAQARETAYTMRNMSNTTVISKYYRHAVDEAVVAVQSGVEDYGSAIRRVIREAGQNGLRIDESGTRKVDYESGYSRRLDTAARMNVLDGVRHLNQSIMEEVGRQFGANGVEIDAHMLCAEDHLPYQGGQYSNEEFEEIQDGLQRPFGEWNCRHSWHPIMLGISPPTYTPDQLEAFERYSTEPVTIDGRTKTRYQWSQEMRRCETAIRQQKDTATLARYAGDESLRRRCQGTIVQLNQRYEQLADRAGLDPEHQRTFVQGFRDTKTASAHDIGAPGTTAIDWASASKFAHEDVRLTNMLRSGDPQQIATAVNEILNGYGFSRESRWKHRVNVRSRDAMRTALGKKEWTCEITIREDNTLNIKTYIHEDLHSRSASHFSPEIYALHRAAEEGAVEFMAQQICERAGIQYNPSYHEQVRALRDIRKILFPNTSDYDFAKTVFDMQEDLRYTGLEKMVIASRERNPHMRIAVRDRLDASLRILAGTKKGE